MDNDRDYARARQTESLTAALSRIADALEASNAKSDRAYALNQQAFNLQKQLAASSAELEMMIKGARKQ